VTSDFARLGEVVAAAEHAPCVYQVAVQHPLGSIPLADVIRKADEAFEKIIDMATGYQVSAGPVTAQAAYPTEQIEFTGTTVALNRFFLDKGWSLGLPVIPPSPEAVQEVLMGTGRKPDDVVGQVPPRMGTLTVELVAVNAVMAGCRPEFMPVLLAALEALLDPSVNWRGSLATTATSQTVVIVNGPIVKELGIASEQGAAGKGHHINGAIGYAINLIAFNVGGSRPPYVDKSTLGSPADYVCWVFGENEDKLPAGWEPLHVDRGFQKSDSVITVLSSYPPVANLDHWSTAPEEHLRWWSHMVSPMLGPTRGMEQNPIVALAPEHAELLGASGWSKADFARALWQNVRIPLGTWPAGGQERVKAAFSSIGPLSPESMVPLVLKPEQFLIVLAGGAGKQSHYFPPFFDSLPASRLVTTQAGRRGDHS